MRAAISTKLTFALILALSLAGGPAIHADSVILKNGSTIHGKAEAKDGIVTIDFGASGKMTISESRIVKIVKDELNAFDISQGKPVPSATGKAVVVTLKADKMRYGTGPYIGWMETSADERMLALRTPEGGRIGILRADVDTIIEVAGEPAATPVPATATTEGNAGPISIPTTHKITLSNGNIIRGNVIDGPEDEPLQIEIAGLGLMAIRRGQILKFEVEAGKIEAPKTVPNLVPAPAGPSQAGPGKAPQTDYEQLKEKLRSELIQELLQSLIDQKIDKELGLVPNSYDLGALGASVPDVRAEQIHGQVLNLTRHRTRDRVRAETKLKAFGSDALPFLEPAAAHPFELSRRAVQRIVREVGDVRGAHYSIVALDDSDVFVRQLAHDALRSLLKTNIPFNAKAGPSARKAARGRYEALWNGILRDALRDELARRL